MTTMSDKKDIRLIALDMDGTLLNEGNQISQANYNAIQKAREQGVEVILCTGRHYITTHEFAKELGLTSYFVTANGSEIWTAAGELVDRQVIDVAIIEALVELHKKYQTYAWMASTKEVFRGEAPVNIADYQWLKFGFDTTDNSIKQKIIEELAADNRIELSNSSLTNVEVNAVGINKAMAIEKVCEHLNITMDHVMTMGDSLNDIRMIEEAGLGIAMGNAQEQVKRAADWVTTSNEEDGVANAINHWILDPNN
ncbi:Cof-type HAD-IIB family hydrolase [Radiobacillus sp. PE A8.2]|uniref:Cof-type HAD-IIB family hydrolase n=1 Tax=Radiobacillus sp. PE A8.2 TaxID=3380349 RepID=UPI00388DA1B7